jgi:hypothetical protein
MDLPIGFEPIENPTDTPKYVLKLNKNLYGLKQASYNWFAKFWDGLQDCGFKASSIDQCLYMKEGMMLLVYVDDCIIVGLDMNDINNFVQSMQNGLENFILMDEGNIDNFLGIEIKCLGPKEFEILQPFLIDWIITFLGLQSEASKTHCNDMFTPAVAQILNKDLQGKPRKKTWKYKTAVGMMSYLQGHSCPDISMPVLQTACFSNDPKLIHEQTITHIGCYLLGTKTRRIWYKIDHSKGLECYVDANFAGGWDLKDLHDTSNLMLRAGFVIKYADCPIYWSSKIQTKIAEYIALSSALCEVIPLVLTIMEGINKVFPLMMNPLNFYCKVWEDNQPCIAMATLQKKYALDKPHHFEVSSFQEIRQVREDSNQLHSYGNAAGWYSNKACRNWTLPKASLHVIGMVNPFPIKSIPPLNTVPQGSMRIIGYGKPFNGPSLYPTSKPKLRFIYISYLLEQIIFQAKLLLSPIQIQIYLCNVTLSGRWHKPTTTTMGRPWQHLAVPWISWAHLPLVKAPTAYTIY